MTKEQKDYVVSQLDKMAEELESVDDVAERAKLRGKYIELFIDLCTIANTVISAPVEEDLIDEEPIEEDDVIEEPESVTAETEAIIEKEIKHRDQVVQEVEEKADNVKNADEIFEDAEVVRTVLNDDEEEVDITEAYNALINDGADSDTADAIGLWLTEYECLEAYMNKFNYMEHGDPRAYAAYMGTVLKEQQLIAYIVDFSNLEIDAVEHSTDFINDANAEALFSFVFQDDEEE